MAVPKQPRRKARIASSPGTAAGLVVPDRSAMEAYLIATDPEAQAAAIFRAQDLIYDAWEQGTSRSRVALAVKALAISPLCADAYSLLAGEATVADETLGLYSRGLEAGSLALGPKGFAELAGKFWRFLETRPYMRARHGLAMTLIEMGRDDEAIGHFRAMLELNPGDNQGIRYLLLASLIRQDDTVGAKALLASYADEWSAHWLYTRALIAYRERQGGQAETLQLLENARSANAHVPAMLQARSGSGRLRRTISRSAARTRPANTFGTSARPGGPRRVPSSGSPAPVANRRRAAPNSIEPGCSPGTRAASSPQR